MNDEYAIVMEFADEGNLKNYLSRNFERLDWNKKFRLALDITNGLHYLHKENILHRDLVSTTYKNISLLIHLINKVFFLIACQKYSNTSGKSKNHRFWSF